MNKIIYAIKVADLSYSGLKILDVKIGQTTNLKSTLTQYKRSHRESEILDLWEANPSKTLSECEKGIHTLAEKYAYEREGEKFIFLQESYRRFSENVNLLLKNIPRDEIEEIIKIRKPIELKKRDYTGRKPKLIKFQGRTYKVNSWREALHAIAKQICEDQKDFSSALDIKGAKRDYFSKEDKNLVNPKRIEGTSYFFEGNISANRTVKIIYQLLSAFGYKKSELEIEMRPR